MAKEQVTSLDEIQIDTSNLYREETITDMKVGSLQRMVPITKDGSEDPGRSPFFVGQTQIMSQAGPIPLSARMEVATLEEAVAQFPQAMKEALDTMMEEVERYQREQASRLVTPSQMGGGGGMPFGPAGGGGASPGAGGSGGNLIL